MVPRWEPSGEGWVVASVVPDSLSWSVEVEARLGYRGVSWVEDCVPVDGELHHALRVPREAWLDPLAADYVTDLRVTLVASDETGRELQRRSLPPAFLAWPSGEGGAVELWDAAQQAERAPAGVVSERVRSELGDLRSIDRVGPPLYEAARNVVTDEEG